MLATQLTALLVFIPFFREEYGKLFDFVNAKKLSIKNRGFKEVGNLESSVSFPCIILSSVISSECEPHICLLSSVDELILLCVFVLCSYVCVPVEKGWYKPCGLRALFNWMFAMCSFMRVNNRKLCRLIQGACRSLKSLIVCSYIFQIKGLICITFMWFHFKFTRFQIWKTFELKCWIKVTRARQVTRVCIKMWLISCTCCWISIHGGKVIQSNSTKRNKPVFHTPGNICFMWMSC